MPDLEMIAKQAKSMLKAEAKGAAPAPSAEIKKTEVEKPKVVEVKPEAILAKEPEVKVEAKVEPKKVEEVKADDKSNVQKRFDELTAKIKDLELDRNSTKAEKENLASELYSIKKQLSMTPEDVTKNKIKIEIQSRIKKYSEEDKELTREDKREMPKEELDEWLLEDYEGASEWLTRRSIRRIQEENHLRQQDFTNRKAQAIIDKQNRSADKTYVKHPELDVFKRGSDLQAQGKSKDEILKILYSESPNFKVYMDIVNENTEKYMLAENGPELIVEEMERRLAPKKPEVNEDVENIKKELAALKAENDRLKGIDIGITSTRQAEPQEAKTDLEKKREELAFKVGLSADRVRQAVKRRVDKGYDG